jgi:predicted small metal-binding protein
MVKVLRCADVRATGCPEVFRGASELEVLHLVLEHWAAVHAQHTTTSTIVSRMRAAIQDE